MKEKGKLKVLGVLEEYGGSRYHRVYNSIYAISGKEIIIEGEKCVIEVDFITCERRKIELKEEMFANYDIIYNSWLTLNSVVDISHWKSEYGTKLINDFDDFWDDETHPQFNPNWRKGVKNMSLVADFSVTTNGILAKELEPFTDKIAIVPNFLPVGEGQYTKKPEDKQFKEGYLRIGLISSTSHANDWILFKPVLNKIAKTKELKDKIEFVIAGCSTNLIEEFKKKKSLKWRVEESKPTDSYMELYNEVDVVIQPLVHNMHNICKSGLKVLESSIKDCIFLGSNLYEYKEFPAFFTCENPLDYTKTLELLLEEGNYVKLKDKFCEENLKRNKWEDRVKFITELVELVANQKEEKIENLKLFSITYDENQIAEFEKYDNSHIRTLEQNSQRFEWNPIVDIVSNKIDNFNGYLGIFSWKFTKKTALTRDLLNKVLKRANFQDFDFIDIARNHLNGEQYLQFTEFSHPGILERLEEVCNIIGLTYRTNPKVTNYSNFFIMKAEYYREFIEDYIKPAIQYIESKPERFMVNANYKAGLSAEELEKLTGLPYYTFETFLLERLILFYVEDKNLNILKLVK